MNLAEFILLVAITAYAVFVIIQKIQKKKRGEGCCCGCEGCTAPCAKKGNLQKNYSEKG